MSPKVNVIAWLVFELTYYDIAVQHVNHYPAGIPTWIVYKVLLLLVAWNHMFVHK